MSNFTGVTFSRQKVLPSDDAIIRRASLTDGILYGCEISYAGSTLTMGAGQMLLCGRQIRNPAAQNWAIVDATSGFARLLLTIDMTRTSSKDVFEQVVDSIEYAASQDGFPELVQENINVSGTRYQVVACVVSLGAGGITGIVNQLGPCEGGGGGLNFKVVGGMTQPANPSENMIWVLTDVPITSWEFSATQPAPPEDGKDGPVWISTAISSTVEFNALKKNGIQVYPTSAKQYVSGALVDKTAKSYLGGDWVDWWNGELYDAGNEYTSITGGWVGVNYSTGSTATGGPIKETDYLTVKNVNNSTWGATTANAVDMTRFETLYVTVNATASGTMDINIADDFPTGTSDNSTSKTIGTTQTTVSFPIDTVSGNKKVHIRWKSTSNNLNIYKVWME